MFFLKKILLSLVAIFTPFMSYSFEASHYLENRIDPTDRRYESFLLSLQLMQNRDVKTIVETGTTRQGINSFPSDGGSTILFGNWAADNNAKLYSIDISEKSIEGAMGATEEYHSNIEFVCNDSITYLKNFSTPIDFLYLDSFDFELKTYKLSQAHHLKEIKAAYPYLHENSVVMIDDCTLPHGGKGKLVIEFLLKRGWQVIYSGYQVILIQRPCRISRPKEDLSYKAVLCIERKG